VPLQLLKARPLSGAPALPIQKPPWMYLRLALLLTQVKF
jgi:hypothetical protein